MAISNMHRSQWGKMDLMSDMIFNRQLFPCKRNKLENQEIKGMKPLIKIRCIGLWEGLTLQKKIKANELEDKTTEAIQIRAQRGQEV